jgi:threonine/homoserine/homoserine lactone efflux protein
MAKVYELLALFLVGVGSVGFLSYLIRIMPKLHRAGIGLIILIFVALVLLIVLDDAIKNYLKTNYYTYILFVVGIAFVLLAGGLLQWL